MFTAVFELRYNIVGRFAVRHFCSEFLNEHVPFGRSTGCVKKFVTMRGTC